ncbi:ABC transporter substrate-binding protein [Bradyrhizobium sp. UFLA05-153]
MKVADMAKDPTYRIFFKELNRVGYVEGQNLVVDRYSAEGARERRADLAREVVSTRPDLICAFGNDLTSAFNAATREIPVVVIAAGDPVALGIAASLAHPGGNITGVAVNVGVEFYGKRLELLKEMVPRLSKAFYLLSQSLLQSAGGMPMREAAKRLGVSLIPVVLAWDNINEAAYENAFKSMEQDRADALLVSTDPEHYAYRTRLVELVAKTRLPAILPDRRFVEIGGLMSYGNDIVESYRLIASQIADILRGTKPEDSPFYQVTKFELVINMKTAKSQGIDVPPALLARADEVIE